MFVIFFLYLFKVSLAASSSLREYEFLWSSLQMGYNKSFKLLVKEVALTTQGNHPETIINFETQVY